MLATQRRPDAVISLSTPPLVALLGLTLARLRGASSLYWVMDVYPQLAFELGVIEPRSIVGRIFRRLSAACLRRSDEVIALGDTMAERLSSEGAGPVTVIHNWADGEAIHPVEPQDNPLRAEWGWSDRFVVLYSGNMGLAHEFDTVLDAAERLAADPRILLAFVGGGPRRAEVEAEARRRGLSNVEFLPYVPREQLGDSLTAGDVHLVTLRERMPGLLVPSKIYGILAAGRPSVYVGPQQGEIADILDSGRCGIGVRGGDADALAEAIRGYANDPARTREHGANARRSFEMRFTREHGVDAFRELLDRACDGRQGEETVQGRVAGR